MRQQTEMMRHILTNKTAQKIIDYVSPVYGNSYVGLWLYQIIGIVLDEVYTIAEQLRYEANPFTTELLLDYWEAEYGLHMDNSLTLEQRKQRLLNKVQYRAPATPKKLADAMAIVLGIPVEITERVAKNTFEVNILNSVADFKKMLHAISVLEARKPAHLIYRVNVSSQVDETDLKLATATTLEESYRVDTQAVKLALQTTLEKAIKLGAVLTHDESYTVGTKPVSMETKTDIESNLLTATGVVFAEEYDITAVKRIAKIAVEAAFSMASSVATTEEYNVKEVITE